MIFQYDPAVIERFPNLAGGVILGQGIKNSLTSPALAGSYFREQQEAVKRIGQQPGLSEIPSLSAWRQAFRAFGVDPTKHRSAPEALLRRLIKKGDIPTINALVDINNLVSIRYALPVATIDLRALTLPVTVRFADGSERYMPLGESEAEHPEPGEVIFIDAAGVGVARRWCWRQSSESAAQLSSSHVLITIEAQHEGGRDDVEAATTLMLSLLREHCSGEFECGRLDAKHPGFAR